jgi:eukaryotic-like serine/threonine-protein kinase
MNEANELNAPPVSGLVAGKYEIVRVIGRGGMGSVWEGRHATLGTRVAVKFIDPEYAQSEEAQVRFANEARAAATIQSKHAIHIYDHGLTEDRRPYIVMELLTGDPLDKRLDVVGRLPLAETARIIGQVCRALQRAHEAGIIHRDLKPENIFLVRTPDDDEDVAKVLDFGIAKIKAGPGDAGISSSTRTGAVMGTPFYMSPEQARGLRSIDTRSDLWSLGVIAYRCVTGVLPFDGESVGDLLVKICTSPLPVPSMLVPGLPRSFDAWFAKALERDPPRRFSTALELSDALALAAGLSVRRGPASSQKSTPDAAGAPYPIPAPVAATLDSPRVETPRPGGGTSAPFVTSNEPPPEVPKNKNVALFVIAAAGVLVGSIAVAAVIKMLGPRPEAPAALAASVPPPMTAAAAPSVATIAPTVTEASVLAPLQPVKPIATQGPTVAAGAPPAWVPPGHKGKAGPSGKASSAPPPATAAPPPVTVAAPPPPPPQPAPAPAPKPATGDPGY